MSATHGIGPTFDRVPPLQSGDHLTRKEFERRNWAMPGKTKAELVDGVVFVATSGVTITHAAAHADLITWLGHYEAHTNGLEGASGPTLRLDARNEFQPDVVLRVSPSFGGQSRTSHDDLMEGAPEMIAEVAICDANLEWHDKLKAYERCCVREYLVWRTWDKAIDWFVLERGHYRRQVPDAQGIVKSTVFPGLWLEVGALLANDFKRVLAVVKDGLATFEHHEYCERLAAQARGDHPNVRP